MKNCCIIIFVISIISATSCVRSYYFYYPIKEIGMTFLVEDNRSNTQRVFLCYDVGNSNVDSLIQHSTQILIGKESADTVSFSILASPSERTVFFIPDITTAFEVIPHNLFVTIDPQGPTIFNDPCCITFVLPFKEKDSVVYWNQGVKHYSTVSRIIKDKHLFVREKKVNSGRGIEELPSYFTKQKNKAYSKIDIKPLERQKGFQYNGTTIVCHIPSGQLDEMCFFIDPSLPRYLFYHDVNYNYPNHRGSFSNYGNNISIVETDNYLFCPGISIEVTNYVLRVNGEVLSVYNQ